MTTQVQSTGAAMVKTVTSPGSERYPAGGTWRQRLVLLCMATLLSLGLCELIARAWFPAPPNPWRDPQIRYLSDPDVGFVHAPNQYGWIEDGRVTINSLGLRGEELISPKPSDHFRIVVLGDSITIGVGVNDHETYCSQLRRLLGEHFTGRTFDVVNCGVNMYSSYQEAAQFQRLAEKLDPDLVLVGFYFNDLWGWREPGEVAASLQQRGNTEAAAPSQEPRVLHMSTKEASFLERQLRASRAAYVLGNKVRALLAKSGDQDGSQTLTQAAILAGETNADLKRAWADVEAPLGRIKAIAHDRGCAAGIVIMPCREQVTRDYPNAQYQTKVREIGERLGFFVIDPLAAFVSQRGRVNELFLPYDGHHPSAPGHRLLAETIVEHVRARPELLKR